MAPPYNLPTPISLGTVYRGDTVELPVWVATDREGNPIDLTGATVWFTAKRDLQTEDLDAGNIALSTAIGGVAIVNALTGEYQVTIPANATVALTAPAVFQWDVQVRTTEPQTLTVAQGTINIHLDVTKTIA